MTAATADPDPHPGDPDPFSARDADSYRRAVHQLLTRHRVFRQDVVSKAHRFGVPGITEAEASQLYTLGETLPDRRLIEVATGLCGLTPIEQELWLDAWDRIEYGPVRYALYKRGPDNQYRLPPVPRPAAMPEADQARWRVLVSYLYAAFGTPPVPGYTGARVEDVLAGRAPLDDRFVNAMLLACEKCADEPAALQGATERMLGDELKRVVSLTPVADGVDLSSLGLLVRAVYAAMQAIGERPHRDLRPENVLLQNRGGIALIDIDYGQLESAPVDSPATAALIERVAEKLDGIQVDPGPPRPAPPDPTGAADIADFVRAMNELKTWSGLSLRRLEAAAKDQGSWELPHSSLADALKTVRLPRKDLLWALTGAVGLAPAQREQWMTVRASLEREASAAPAGAESAAEPEEDDLLPEPPQPEPAATPDSVESPVAAVRDTTLEDAADLYTVLRTVRQRLVHQCGYQGACAEGVTETQAPQFTARDATRDGRVWLPGVASVYGREQLARAVLRHLEPLRGRRQRRLLEQLVTLVGQETVELMESRLHVPAAEFSQEAERRRRELIEYRIDRESANAAPGDRYEYVARYGLLAVAASSPNDVLRHQQDIKNVLAALDTMADVLDPQRPFRGLIG